MPLFPLIQVIVSRVVIGIIAILATLGLGSVSEPIATNTTNQTDAPQEVATEEPEAPQEAEKDPQKTVETPEEPTAKEGTPTTTPLETVQGLTEEPDEAIITETATSTHKEPLTFAEINTNTTEALVNILCSQNVATAVTPITGSGVIIDPRGVIITNAHVAQFFLLKDYPVEDALSCIIRTGSPARPMYTAELLYIPPIWISEHAEDITDSEPTGTGENDYAFLRITGRTSPDAGGLPTSSSYLPMDAEATIETGAPVLVAGYPAGFLGGISVQKDLYSVSSITTIGERFTFNTNTIDLFSTGGTVVSQGGSSGGAVVSAKEKLVGVIVTSTNGDTTAERDLRAISVGHINRSLFEYSNTTIDALLFGDVALRARLFNIGTAPALTDILVNSLNN
ncbi:MAG: serine protease [Candidatus Pacebacteria bacterium]|nr:serine protease [Candidatus Paceibacterota bacterium]